MRRKIVCLLMCMVLGLSMVACDSADDNKDKATKDTTQSAKETKTAEEKFSIKMNDKYTFTDPEDLEFDKRYVLVGDKSSKLLNDMKNSGYSVENMYEILYAKDGEAVKEYQYFVCPDKQSATDLVDFYSSQGQKVTQEDCILYAVMEKEVLQATITMFTSMGNMGGETPEDYIAFLSSFNGLVEY